MELAKRLIDFKALLSWARGLFGGVPFMIFEMVIAVAVAALEMEQFGAFFFVSLIAVKLLVCEDLLVTTLPFLLVATFATRASLDFLNTFKDVMIIAPPAIACFIFHFVVYKRPVYGGTSGFGLGLVSIAVTLGGVGRYALGEYLHWAYYVIGLGVGMFLAYFLMKSQFSVRHGYNERKRFALIMTLLGVYCVCLVAIGYVRKWLDLPMGVYIRWVSPNNISTFLMFAMPFPLYLSRGRYCKWLLSLILVFYVAIVAIVSRGGMLMGGLEFAVIAVYWARDRKWKRIVLGACAAVIVGMVVLLWDLISQRFFGHDWTEESRFKMILESLAAFKDGPLFGTGILDTSLDFNDARKDGMLCWYHMMIPQVIGSMGLVGVAAYGRQILDRFRLILKRADAWSICLGLSYLGVLLMSQVNPGEFCPIPFSLMTVILFIMQERRLEEYTLPISQDAWRINIAQRRDFFEIA